MKLPHVVFSRTLEEYPLLTKEQELKLATTIQGKGKAKQKKQAIEKLVLSNMRLALKIINEEYGWYSDKEDLVSEAAIGLNTAAHKFQAAKNVRFSTYASWHIRQRVQKYIETSKTIRLPSEVLSAYGRVQRISDKLFEELGYYPSIEEISDITGVSVKRLEDIDGYQYKYVPLNAPLYKNSKNETTTVAETVADEGAVLPDDNAERAIDTTELAKTFKEFFKELTYRERMVLSRRFGMNGYHQARLVDIGKSFKVSRERIRQIQNAALSKLKRKYLCKVKGFENNLLSDELSKLKVPSSSSTLNTIYDDNTTTYTPSKRGGFKSTNQPARLLSYS